MEKILEELWYGNVCPNIKTGELTKEAKDLMRYMANHYENLQSTLTEEQRETLKKFDECYAELMATKEREIFVYAFKLGARIALAVIDYDTFK